MISAVLSLAVAVHSADLTATDASLSTVFGDPQQGAMLLVTTVPGDRP